MTLTPFGPRPVTLTVDAFDTAGRHRECSGAGQHKIAWAGVAGALAAHRLAGPADRCGLGPRGNRQKYADKPRYHRSMFIRPAATTRQPQQCHTPRDWRSHRAALPRIGTRMGRRRYPRVRARLTAMAVSPLVIFGVAVALLVAANLLNNRFAPSAYMVTSPVAAALLLVLYGLAGGDWAAAGFGRAELGRGLRWGLVLAVLVAVGYLVGALVPATRG